MTQFTDDDLSHLETHGMPSLPAAETSGYAINEGARIWYASHGHGTPVILLHGGLGHGGNWGYQVPALVAAGYRAVTVDSRGQGRSTRDDQAYSYELMARDVSAVMEELAIERAAFIGWSDGADIALVLSREMPERSRGVYFFGCNVDASGALPFEMRPTIGRIYNHHVKEYAALSPVIGGFERMRDDLNVMQGAQPNYGPEILREITVPVWSVIAEHDEFIRREHAEYIAAAIPGARFEMMPGVSHFAPMQRPALFNASILAFLAALPD